MSEPTGKGSSYVRRLWYRFKGQIIQDVPQDYQACEFECRKLECLMGDWERCERRLDAKVQGREQA
jgi:hypothetical protein